MAQGNSQPNINLKKVNGTTTDSNSGAKSAGTLRVVLATDQPALTNKLLVTPDSVALPANQSVNVSQINAVTPLMGNGVTGTGSQRVTIASDNTAFSVNANAGTNLNTSALALDATLTGGTAKSIVRGGAKGSTTAADVTSTSQSADRNALDVQIRTSAGVVVDTFGGGTQFADGAVRGTATGTLMMVDDGTNIQSALGDTSGRLFTNVAQINGVTPLMGTGIMGTGSPRVTIASDNDPLIVKQATAANLNATVVGTGTFAVQATPVTQADTFMLGGVNVKEINAVAPLMGNGVTGTGSQRVTIASDNTAFSVNASGTKTNNNAVPGATNIGTLSAVSTASAPSYTEGNLVALSVDNSGALRTSAAAATVSDVTATGSLVATGSVTTATLNGANTVGFYLSGTWVATVQFEATIDGTNYFSVNAVPITGGAIVTSATGNGQWQVDAGGYANVRARVSAYTSGTVAINLRSSTGSALVGINNPLPSGTNVIGHVINDSGSTTAVTGNVTVVQPTGTNLHAVLDANSGVDIGKLTANQSVNVSQINGVTPLMGSGIMGTGSPRVTIASDNDPLIVKQATAANLNMTEASGAGILTSVQLIDDTITAQGTALGATKTNLSGASVTTAAPTYTTGQINPLSLTTAGALRTDGSGVTQPVSLTSTTVTGNVTVVQPTGTNLHAVLDANTGVDIGKLTANQSVNMAQVAGTNTVTGGVAGLLAVAGNVANAVAATANPVPVGGVFTTAPATLTTGQTATAQFTAAQNLKSDISTIAGTAPTTAGFIDVKGADGNVFVRQTTGTNLHVVTDATSVTAATLGAETTKVIGTVRVQGNVGGVMDAVSGAAVPANALMVGGGSVAGATNLTPLTVKVASVAAAATDTSVVTQISPGQPALTTAGVFSVKVDQTTPGTTNAVSVAQIGATTVTTGVGASSAGTQRVVTSTDSTIGTVTAVTSITNNVNVIGTKTNNNAAPGATNVGTLGSLANAATPTWTEGNLVATSVDLSGRARTDNSSWGGTALTAATVTAPAGTEAAPTTRPIQRRSSAIVTTANLSGAAVYTGSWIDTNTEGTLFVQAAARADVISGVAGFELDETDDTTDANFTRVVDAVTVLANTTTYLESAIRGRYWRVKYTNGASVQTSFKLTASASNQSPVNTTNQQINISIPNSSTTNLATGATFTGGDDSNISAGAIQVFLGTDQNCTVYLDQSQDGVNWDCIDSWKYTANSMGSDSSRTIQAVGAYIRTRVTNTGTATTTFFRLQTIIASILEALPRALTQNGNLKVSIQEINGLTPTVETANGVVQTISRDPDSKTLLEQLLAEFQAFNQSQGVNTGAAKPSPVLDYTNRTISTIANSSDKIRTTNTTITASTAETTIFIGNPAGNASADLLAIIISNTSASTNTRVDIRDSTTGPIVMALQSVGGANPVGFSLGGVAIPQQTRGGNWTATCATSTTDIRILAIWSIN